MNNWILARGREAEAAVPDVVAAGARSIALPGAGLFPPPAMLFISEAGGGEAQWLGRATQATATNVTFSRPVLASKESGARLWRPASLMEFPPESVVPERQALLPGVSTERSAGGSFLAVQTTQPLSTLRLRFEGLGATVEDALIAWLAEQAQWGLNPFTLVTPEGALAAVRLAGEPILRERDAAGRRRLILPLVIQQEGVYP